MERWEPERSYGSGDTEAQICFLERAGAVARRVVIKVGTEEPALRVN